MLSRVTLEMLAMWQQRRVYIQPSREFFLKSEERKEEIILEFRTVPYHTVWYGTGTVTTAVLYKSVPNVRHLRLISIFHTTVPRDVAYRVTPGTLLVFVFILKKSQTYRKA